MAADTRFYCEKCGGDVEYNTSICPFCGEVFNAVKCPICKMIGKPEQFRKGCPSCGFKPRSADMNNVILKSKNRSRKKKRGITLKQHFPPAFYYVMLVALIAAVIVFLALLIATD